MFKLFGTERYWEWFSAQDLKIQCLINSRLERIVEYGHFGDARHLSKRLSELKWKNGLRLYFSISFDPEGKTMIILLGGTKKTQKSDIQKAKKLMMELLKEE